MHHIKMPRASREQTENHRQAITDVSARLMRERGIKSVSVSDLMGAAGLTHGGFYGHFDSKDALAAAACARAFEQSVQRWKGRVAGQPNAALALQALIEGFLSVHNRDNPGTSCPTTALAGDVAREAMDAPVRAAYLAGIKGLLDILYGLQRGGARAAGQRQALAQLATMVGALLLARATAGDPLSEKFLAAAREALRPLEAPNAPAATSRSRRN
jgi:TetR/AcrR family transcriptional repressor of nem operon